MQGLLQCVPFGGFDVVIMLECIYLLRANHALHDDYKIEAAAQHFAWGSFDVC